MIKLIKNVQVYSPDNLGKKDILISGESIAAIEDNIDLPVNLPGSEIVDCGNMIATPGFIDSHVHIDGGGGEGSFATRTPGMKLSDATAGGVTSVIGTRGTDGMARSMDSLIARAKSLREQGISCWILTGSYQVPVDTLTGKIETDLMLIDEVIGVGEIAISDHRSSEPTFEELAKIVTASRVGGMLSGKAGIVNFHLGDAETGLQPIKEIIQKTNVPAKHFVPTHIGRNPNLFEEGIDFAKIGGYIDFTTSTIQLFLDEGETKCSQALKICLDKGVPVQNITFTSDGQGSLPGFDQEGNLTELTIGTCKSLFPEVRDAVTEEKIPLEIALKVITSNPAAIFNLPKKGILKAGFDADLVLLTPDDLKIESVYSKGQLMVKDGQAVKKGHFE